MQRCFYSSRFRIRAFNSTVEGRHVHSREEVLGPNPTTPTFSPNAFAAGWRLLRNAPSKGHHSRYITLFFKGTYSVVSLFEMMKVSLAGLKHFLRELWGNLSLFPCFY